MRWDVIVGIIGVVLGISMAFWVGFGKPNENAAERENTPQSDRSLNTRISA